MGSQANRWYSGQYSRWRIDEGVANGAATKRVVIGLVIFAICAPLTTYRATQLRLDPRACLGNLRSGETVEDLMASRDVPDVATLGSTLADQVAVLQANFDRLDAIADPTDEQNSERDHGSCAGKPTRRRPPHQRLYI